MVLRAGTGTAGAAWVLGIPCIPAPYCVRINGISIGCPVCLASGLNGAHNLVVEQALIEIHVFCIIWVVCVQILGQLQQVICGTGLADFISIIGVYHANLVVSPAEFLFVAVISANTADGEGITPKDIIPEILGNIVVFRVVTALELPECADNLRNMLVAVQGTDGIPVIGQRAEEGDVPVSLLAPLLSK